MVFSESDFSDWDETPGLYPGPSQPFLNGEQSPRSNILENVVRDESRHAGFQHNGIDTAGSDDAVQNQQSHSTGLEHAPLHQQDFVPAARTFAGADVLTLSSLTRPHTAPAPCPAPVPKAETVYNSHIATPPSHAKTSLQRTGKWRCCKCERGYNIVAFAKGPHPVSTLNCICTHRSCLTCSLEGCIRHFEPMNDPEVVQLSDDKRKQIQFGVFCGGCGLSWRAQGVDRNQSKKSVFHRLSALPKRLVKRRAHPLETIRHSKSLSHLSRPRLTQYPVPASCSALNLQALSSEMAKEYGKQAEFATVKFKGIQCSCGTITADRSLCFQIVEGSHELCEAKGANITAEHEAIRLANTLSDQARGHGTPVLILKGVVAHINPLMSHPVTEGDLCAS